MESHTKAGAPILEVLRRYPKQVLLAIGARVGVDVAFYTFVLFITTYVATYLKLPRNYALNAVLMPLPSRSCRSHFFGSLSDRLARRPVYLAGAIGAAVWVFVFFALLDTGQFWLIVLATVVALVSTPPCMAAGAFIRDVPDQGSLHRRLDGLPAGRHHRRGARADHLGGPAGPLRHLDRRVLYAVAMLLVTIICVLLAPETSKIDLHADPRASGGHR